MLPKIGLSLIALSSILVQASTRLRIDTEIWNAVQVLQVLVYTASRNIYVISLKVSVQCMRNAFSPSDQKLSVTGGGVTLCRYVSEG